MTAIQALILAVVQGLTELFPISSLGHAVLLPSVLGWKIDQTSESFLPFLVVLHLGTASALLLFFWRDWADLLGAVVGIGAAERRDENRRLLFLIVVATIPAALIGFLLEKRLRLLFGSPDVAAAFLMVNGLILFAGERRRRKAGFRAAGQLTWKEALGIGVWQSVALIPGISRSGVTIVAGLVAGLRHQEAARFSFLLATPVIAGAGVVELPKLLSARGSGELGIYAASGVVAGVVAYLSVAFLMRYFRRREIESLNPFAYYCWAAGAVLLLVVGLFH